MILTRENLRKLVRKSIVLAFFANHSEDIDHLFNQYYFVNEIWTTVMIIILYLSKAIFISQTYYKCKYETIYSKIYHKPLEKSKLLFDPYGHTENNL